MKKKVFGKKFSRDSTSRRAMYRALLRSFVINRKLTTTDAKGKVIVPMIESMFQKAKSTSLTDRKSIYKFTGNDREITDKLIEISRKISVSDGGHLRSVDLPARKGDNAPMVRIELSQKIEVKEVKKDGGKEHAKSGQKNTEKTEGKPSAASVIKKLSFKKKQIKSVKK